jgi:hypothetical protein
MIKNFACFSFVFIIFILNGCNSNIQFGGKITFSEDGSPLTRGVVCFETDTFAARGNLTPDGTYILGSVAEKDGLPAGKYRVYIAGALKENGLDKYNQPIYEPVIDTKYASKETSGLECNVNKSTKHFDFQVERYAPAKK